jgi:protein-ribulosamine 3-kinase
VTRLPGDVTAAVEAAAGAGARVEAVEPIGGGCVTPAARLRLRDGRSVFLKWAGSGRFPDRLFTEEARSLRALRDSGAVQVPAVLGEHARWLLLEWLEPGPPGRGAWPRLGRELAALHRTRADRYGWEADNFIGPLPQSNARTAGWAEFWRERRLLPQLARARAAGFLDAGPDAAAFDALLDSLDAWLAPAAEEGPSLLHGDLWNGNVHMMATGRAALVDPSTAYGHREVDLAMARLFGGFDAAFYDAYAEAWPLHDGHDERRDIYQLYYLLVHVNLFGSGYLALTRERLRRLAHRTR